MDVCRHHLDTALVIILPMAIFATKDTTLAKTNQDNSNQVSEMVVVQPEDTLPKTTLCPAGQKIM